MFSRPMINLGGTMQVVDMTTGQVTEKPSGMMLLPAAPGKCPECAADHPPELPHNRDSLFYQMRFHAEHKRWPVWADALAHCDEVMRAAWESELRSRGVWRDPEPIEPVKHETPVPADALLQPGTEITTQDPCKPDIFEATYERA